MRTQKLRRKKRKSRKHKRINRTRTHKRKQRAGVKVGSFHFPSWIGKGFGAGGTGFDNMGNIFKQLKKLTLKI